MTNVLIVFYSTWGHMYQMAKAVEEGAKSVKDTTIRLMQVAELIPKEKWDEGIKKAKEMMTRRTRNYFDNVNDSNVSFRHDYCWHPLH